MKETKLKKLKTFTLAEAMKQMEVGETCLAPDDYSPLNIKTECTRLAKQGYLFTSSKRLGPQTITRLR
jgi:hypothetical protein